MLTLGAVYVGGLLAMYPRTLSLPRGEHWVLLGILSVSAGDTMAYFTGRALGRRKLAPALSPNKTVEGAAGRAAGERRVRRPVRPLLPSRDPRVVRRPRGRGHRDLRAGRGPVRVAAQAGRGGQGQRDDLPGPRRDLRPGGRHRGRRPRSSSCWRRRPPWWGRGDEAAGSGRPRRHRLRGPERPRRHRPVPPAVPGDRPVRRDQRPRPGRPRADPPPRHRLPLGRRRGVAPEGAPPRDARRLRGAGDDGSRVRRERRHRPRGGLRHLVAASRDRGGGGGEADRPGEQGAPRDGREVPDRRGAAGRGGDPARGQRAFRGVPGRSGKTAGRTSSGSSSPLRAGRSAAAPSRRCGPPRSRRRSGTRSGGWARRSRWTPRR